MTRRTLSLAIVAPVAILIVAAGVRFWGISNPGAPYWDEPFYVYDANAYLGGGFGIAIDDPPAVRIADESTWVHPPMGKWIIALLGEGPLGLRSIGWRFPSALFGIAGVLLVYLIAIELWRSIGWASFAAGMLALDGLHIVQSRIAMLDIFLSTFVLAGVLFLVRDRKGMGGITPRQSRAWRWFGTRDRALAGVMFGAAIACKWTGVFGLIAAIAMLAVWSIRGCERSTRTLVASCGTIAASLVVLPTLVYLISYGAFWFQHGPAFADFITLQARMFEYHASHLQVQPENSPAWTWPLLLHPIEYFRAQHQGSVQAIVALGNPGIWWGFLLLLPLSVLGILRRLDWRDAVVFGMVLALFAPWLFVGRTQFIFYMLPAVPFLCLGIAATLRGLEGHVRSVATWSVGLATLTAAVLFLPIWVGASIPKGWSDLLRWLPSWP
ncbi:MAG TPA: phospholipid carrier-dependent glycosyltransferase [Actinomycetota bacterium]